MKEKYTQSAEDSELLVSDSPYIQVLGQLGPDDTRGLVGGKAFNLDILLKNGAPVPDGVTISTDAHDYYLEHGAFPAGLVGEIEAIRNQLGGSVAVRSSANLEDSEDLSMAGVFSSLYLRPDQDIAAGIAEIYTQAHSREVAEYLVLHNVAATDVRMGIVVQRLIAADRSGVVYTGVGESDKLLVQYTDGFGEKLVDGETQGTSVIVDPNGNIIQSSRFESIPMDEKALQTLIQLSRQIKTLYGGRNQDIEFALEGDKVFILQARPLTSSIDSVELEETLEDTIDRTKKKLQTLVAREKDELSTERVVFSDSNFSELLPRPAEMDFGVFAYIFTGSDGIPGGIQIGRSQMGYVIGPESVGYTQYIGGKPYFSLARDAATFYMGIPHNPKDYFASLGKEYLNTVFADPSRAAYPEMGLYLQDPTYEDLKARFGNEAKVYYARYMQFKEQMALHATEFLARFRQDRLPNMVNFLQQKQIVPISELTPDEIVAYTQDILEHLRTVSCVDFVKAARLGFYYSQRLQSELRSRLGLPEDKIEEIFASLSQGLEGSQITEVNIAIAQARSDEEALIIAQNLIGHFSAGEMLEVRHPRLRSDKNALQGYVEGIRRGQDYESNYRQQVSSREQIEAELFGQVKTEDVPGLRQLIRTSQQYMALRETIKYYFTQEYEVLRNALEHLEKSLGLAEGDIYHIFPRELSQLVEKPASMKHVIRARRQAFDHYPDINIPAVIRDIDIDSIAPNSSSAESFTELRGKFISKGEAVQGVIVNVDDFDDVQEAAQVQKEYQERGIPVILVAKQINLGHDPLIINAAGLVIENAGMVSHGAQRARELGTGAIAGIRAAMLKTGVMVDFNPNERSIKRA